MRHEVERLGDFLTGAMLQRVIDLAGYRSAGGNHRRVRSGRVQCGHRLLVIRGDGRAIIRLVQDAHTALGQRVARVDGFQVAFDGLRVCGAVQGVDAFQFGGAFGVPVLALAVHDECAANRGFGGGNGFEVEDGADFL